MNCLNVIITVLYNDKHLEYILNKIQASDFRHGNYYLSLCECIDFTSFYHDFFAALN